MFCRPSEPQSRRFGVNARTLILYSAPELKSGLDEVHQVMVAARTMPARKFLASFTSIDLGA